MKKEKEEQKKLSCHISADSWLFFEVQYNKIENGRGIRTCSNSGWGGGKRVKKNTMKNK